MKRRSRGRRGELPERVPLSGCRITPISVDHGIRVPRVAVELALTPLFYAMPNALTSLSANERERRSPRITTLAWGRIEVEGVGKFKDAKVFPGGAREWDWNETGTAHEPGIQPADVTELLDHGATTIVLSQGRLKRLHYAHKPCNCCGSAACEHTCCRRRRRSSCTTGCAIGSKWQDYFTRRASANFDRLRPVAFAGLVVPAALTCSNRCTLLRFGKSLTAYPNSFFPLLSSPLQINAAAARRAVLECAPAPARRGRPAHPRRSGVSPFREAGAWNQVGCPAAP